MKGRMKHLKKLLALLMAVVMVLSLAACGAKEETKAPAEEAPAQEAAVPAEIKEILGEGATPRLSKMITSVIENSDDDIKMAPEVAEASKLLEEFMFANVYTNPVAKSQEHKAEALVKELYGFFLETPNALPAEYQSIAMRDGLDRAVCDYISGMSDRYAIKLYNDFFVPKGWSRE